MALLERILLVLATLPLLQPPGVCCCRAGTRAAEPPPVELPAPAKKCRCCQPQEPRAKPAPPPVEHHPDCPVLVGVDQTRYTEPTVFPFDVALALRTSPTAWDMPLIVGSAGPPVTDSPPFPPPPFVLRC